MSYAASLLKAYVPANLTLEECLSIVKKRHLQAVAAKRDVGKNYFANLPITKNVLLGALAVTQGWSILCTPHEEQETLALDAVSITNEILRHLPQTPELCWKACQMSPYNIEYIHEPSEELMRMVCQMDASLIRYAKNPSRDLVWECAKRWGEALKYATHQDHELCLHAIRHFSYAVQFIRSPIYSPIGQPA